MKLNALFVSTVVVLAMMAVPALADNILYYEDFESYDIGTSLIDAGFVDKLGGTNTGVVDLNGGTGNKGWTGNGTACYPMKEIPVTSGEKVTIRWEYYVPTSTASGGIQIQAPFASPTTWYAEIKLTASANSGWYTELGGIGTYNPLAARVVGDVNVIEFVMDVPNEQYWATVNGVSTGIGSMDQATAQTIDVFNLLGNWTVSGIWLESVTVSEVPEPVTLAVLAIGGLLALARRRR